MDAHMIRFTTIDVVRFKKVKGYELPKDEDIEGEEMVMAKRPIISPVTIWIGVFPESTSATAAHNAAQEVLALLKDYEITDVDIEYRESLYTREAGPQLLQHADDLDPLVDFTSSPTPILGLPISIRARPNAQGTMAIYLAEGGGKNNLLGLSCNHVLIGSEEANVDYVYQPSAPSRDVLLLGDGALINFMNLIKLKIEEYNINVECWRREIEWLIEWEKDTDAVDAKKAANLKMSRIRTQRLLNNTEDTIKALGPFLNQLHKDWEKLDNRVLGNVLHSPPIRLGVGEHCFTEDWGIFRVNKDKLGDGFQGNKLDLGTKLDPSQFTMKCFPTDVRVKRFPTDARWNFKYPINRLLPLIGTMGDELMRTPDMWDASSEPCLLVVKNGSATGATLGRANGVFSIVREYFTDMLVNQTSMEWAIINFDSESEVFSEPGDSGSIIADICGRIGGMLTGSAGKPLSSDVTYATPFWWLLERIRHNGFPDAHLDVLA